MSGGAQVRRSRRPPDAHATSVLVLAAHLRPGPWACASLSRAGYRVVAGSNRSMPGVRAAQSVGASRFIRSPDADGERFLADVARIVREDAIDIVLPLTESGLSILVESADDDVAARVAGPTRAQYAQLADKDRLAALARAVGLPTLDGLMVGPDYDRRDLPPAPVVVKPRNSVGRVAGNTRYVPPRMARTDAERDAAVRDIVAATGGALVQPFAPGDRWHVHAWRSARASGGIAARILRSWPPVTGMTSASRIDAAGLDVMAPLIDLLDQIGYRGVVSADFIEMADGRRALHDINPRLPFSVAEAIRGGVDTPVLAVEIARGLEPDATRHVPMDGRRYHWLTGELRWAAHRGDPRVAGDIGRSLAGRGAVVDPIARGTALAGAIDLAGRAIEKRRRR